eukprot:1148832-Pelagomonas_calceolata.AAC.1
MQECEEQGAGRQEFDGDARNKRNWGEIWMLMSVSCSCGVVLVLMKDAPRAHSRASKVQYVLIMKLHHARRQPRRLAAIRLQLKKQHPVLGRSGSRPTASAKLLL